MCTKNGSYCEKEKSQGGQGRCERRSEAFGKIKKRGGGRVGWGCQGGCERRSEAFVKNIYIYIFFFFGGGGGGSGWGVRVDVNGEVKLL